MEPKKAALGDLRGSGTIEQDADAVVFIESEVTGERRLQGPNDYFEVSLRVSKNREGENRPGAHVVAASVS